MGDKRRVPRVSWFVDAKVFIVNEETHWTVRLSDISEGGCFVDTIVPLDPGAKVILKIDDGKVKMDIPGKILYGQVGIGSALEFEPLNEELRSLILKVMESRAAQNSI